MMNPPQIVFHDLESSDFMQARIHEHIAKLEKFFDRITSCRVTVEAPHRSHHKGNHYAVRIDLLVPGHELVVNRDPEQRRQREDAYAAIDDAFGEAERQLKEYARTQRGEVKRHLDPSDPRSDKLGALAGRSPRKRRARGLTRRATAARGRVASSGWRSSGVRGGSP
ncbi:MAG: HPF/RaiA family ribosome-associated protein [Polyangiaceae bacterium]|jgi:ribosomal subunit interface protein|nr:HPF/RaiA family ribosome-associated protein [Polyangiaceae bacterium]